MNKISVSVTDLASYISRRGNLAGGSYGSVSGIEGTRLHQRVFSDLKKAYGDIVFTEESLIYDYISESGICLSVNGRFDAMLLNPGKAPMLFEKKMADNEESDYTLPWTRQACLDAYKRAGLGVQDIDVFETHDCFTSSEYAAISAFGLTEPGKEFVAVESGLIAFDGDKPINPSGGLIGCGHPVGASGARMLLDLYKQVTGTAGGYQVEGAKTGMMLNIGGSATTNYVFIIGY